MIVQRSLGTIFFRSKSRSAFNLSKTFFKSPHAKSINFRRKESLSLQSTRLYTTENSSSTSNRSTTGLSGLPVHPNPKASLMEYYGKTLSLIRENMPKDYVYRRQMEKILTSKLKWLENFKGNLSTNQEEKDDPLGQRSAMGWLPVESIIIQAEYEFDLVKKMVEWKSWESKKTEINQLPEHGWKYFEEDRSS